jgi:hypothetical protein
MLLTLEPYSAHQGVAARIVLRWGRSLSERHAVLEVLLGTAQRVGGCDVDMPLLGGRVVDACHAREEDVRYLATGEGIGRGCRHVRVGVQVVDEDRLNVLVGLATLGHQMPAKAQLDPLVGRRVPATMRARCVRSVVVVAQREAELRADAKLLVGWWTPMGPLFGFLWKIYKFLEVQKVSQKVLVAQLVERCLHNCNVEVLSKFTLLAVIHHESIGRGNGFDRKNFPGLTLSADQD